MPQDTTSADANNNFPGLFISTKLNFPRPADSDMNEIHIVNVKLFCRSGIMQLGILIS